MYVCMCVCMYVCVCVCSCVLNADAKLFEAYVCLCPHAALIFVRVLLHLCPHTLCSMPKR